MDWVPPDNLQLARHNLDQVLSKQQHVGTNRKEERHIDHPTDVKVQEMERLSKGCCYDVDVARQMESMPLLIQLGSGSNQCLLSLEVGTCLVGGGHPELQWEVESPCRSTTASLQTQSLARSGSSFDEVQVGQGGACETRMS